VIISTLAHVDTFQYSGSFAQNHTISISNGVRTQALNACVLCADNTANSDAIRNKQAVQSVIYFNVT
jgi:hypothetical protein